MGKAIRNFRENPCEDNEKEREIHCEMKSLTLWKVKANPGLKTTALQSLESQLRFSIVKANPGLKTTALRLSFRQNCMDISNRIAGEIEGF